jgi:Tol biopolymer transport system component
VYFTHGLGDRRQIMVSSLRGRSWTAPVVAPFSGEWMDIEPAMAPDGSYLVFVSNRPATPGGKPLDGTFGGQVHPGRGGNLWRVDLRGARSVAERLPDAINRDSSIYGPAIGRDGTVYFMGHGPKAGKSQLYAARFRAGRFLLPEPLPFSDETTMDCDPAIARDGSFLVFSSGRAPTPAKQSGLFVSRAERGGWSTPIPLGIFGQEARLSADGATLYFRSDQPTASTASDGVERLYQVAIATFLHPRAGAAQPSPGP